jgi:hypothetical protein
MDEEEEVMIRYSRQQDQVLAICIDQGYARSVAR